MKKLLITAAIIATATTANASKLDDVLNYTGNKLTATFILDTCSLLKNKYVSESDHSKLQQIAIEREICGYYKKSKSTQPVVKEKPKKIAIPKIIPTKPVSKGDWIVSSETNPLDDSTTVKAILFASTGKGTWGDRVVLVARCQSNKTEVYTNWQSYMGNGGIYGSDMHAVTVRIGTNKSKRQYWHYSTDGKSNFAPQPIKLLRQIVKSNSTKLVLQATPYSESPITAIFDTTGSKEALATLAKTCNWKFK